MSLPAEKRARRITARVIRPHDAPFDEPPRCTPEESVALVWELTQEVWELRGEDIAESGLQRHIARVLRPGR